MSSGTSPAAANIAGGSVRKEIARRRVVVPRHRALDAATPPPPGCRLRSHRPAGWRAATGSMAPAASCQPSPRCRPRFEHQRAPPPQTRGRAHRAGRGRFRRCDDRVASTVMSVGRQRRQLRRERPPGRERAFELRRPPPAIDTGGGSGVGTGSAAAVSISVFSAATSPSSVVSAVSAVPDRVPSAATSDCSAASATSRSPMFSAIAPASADDAPAAIASTRLVSVLQPRLDRTRIDRLRRRAHLGKPALERREPRERCRPPSYRPRVRTSMVPASAAASRSSSVVTRSACAASSGARFGTCGPGSGTSVAST